MIDLIEAIKFLIPSLSLRQKQKVNNNTIIVGSMVKIRGAVKLPFFFNHKESP